MKNESLAIIEEMQLSFPENLLQLPGVSHAPHRMGATAVRPGGWSNLIKGATVCGIATIMALAGVSAQEVLIRQQTAATTNWQVAAHWSPAQIPTDEDDTIFGNEVWTAAAIVRMADDYEAEARDVIFRRNTNVSGSVLVGDSAGSLTARNLITNPNEEALRLFQFIHEDFTVTFSGDATVNSGVAFGQASQASTEDRSGIKDVTIEGTTTILNTGEWSSRIEFSRITGTVHLGSLVMEDGGELRMTTGSGANGTPDGGTNVINVRSLAGNGGVIRTNKDNTTGELNIDSGVAAEHSFAGLIEDGAGTVRVVKGGVATQILTGANTYSGGTTISNGTLLANNADGSALGTGEVNVTGGILGGTGEIALADSDMIFSGTSTLAVGNVNDPTGTGIVDLLIRKDSGTMNLTMTSDVTVRLDIWSGSDYERLVFGSGADALSLISLGGATLRIESGFGGWSAGQSFEIIDWGGVAPGTLFGDLELPNIGSLEWDTSQLYTAGTISVIPEPGAGMLLGILGVAFLLYRARARCRA